MWNKLAKSILRFRYVLLSLLLAFTVVMAFHARLVHMTYSAPQVIPSDNPKYADYLAFKKAFGEDGNVMVLGIQSDRFFTVNIFNAWNDLTNQVKSVPGVDEVISVGKTVMFVKDTALQKFRVAPVFPDHIYDQHQLDSLKNVFLSQPFYKGLMYNPETNATLLAVHINSQRLNTKDRIETVDAIQEYGGLFNARTHLPIHYSGMPLIRTTMTTEIADEMKLFTLLAILITALVLYLLLRSLTSVIFSMTVVIIAVIWTLGTIQWMGFEITLLTGLLPPLVTVISITNCVYLINKYHLEFVKHGNKTEALTRVVEKIGEATMFTNLTAAIGFGVFYFTKSEILKEFGLIAGLSIAGIFVISIILIPCVFSLLPPPKTKHTNYLEQKTLNRILQFLENAVQTRRKLIFIVTAILVIVAGFGILQLKTTGYIVDDIPHKSSLYTDLQFFENNFHGVMPLEILVDTKKKGGVTSPARLAKLDELQDSLQKFPEFSRPLSIVEGLKFIRQSYYGGDTSQYQLPGDLERAFIFSYLGNSKDSTHMIASFVDSSRQVARISLSMADIGTEKMKGLIDRLNSTIYHVMDTSKYKVTVTGSSVTFLEGNRYIIDGLAKSLLLAFLLIAICMGYLFRSVRMIIFSCIPNLIPLIITAGIMGYFHIPLKPSTVLIFSVAFGIAIDNAIRFLAKYQQELHRHQWNIETTVRVALYEAGISILYTSIILFFGFIIFTLSSFGGTFYLGLLTSITLIVAMFNNLLLLPSLLLALRKWVNRGNLSKKADVEQMETTDETQVPAWVVNDKR